MGSNGKSNAQSNKSNRKSGRVLTSGCNHGKTGNGAARAPLPDGPGLLAGLLAFAHILIGEPVTTPDQVRGRLSPGYALKPGREKPRLGFLPPTIGKPAQQRMRKSRGKN
jgi:hypothetical protein